jgi:hypothetical protein
MKQMCMGRRKNLVHENIKRHRIMKANLNSQQELFCQQVASGKNQSEAYRNSYPKSQKWKEKAVWTQASILMSNSKVSNRVNELKEKNQVRNEVKLDEVLENLAKYLRFNIKSIVNSNGTLKGFDEMTDDEAACIASFESYETNKNGEVVGVLRKVKLIDKLGTAEKFLRTMGAYINNRNHRFEKENLDHLKQIVDSIK